MNTTIANTKQIRKLFKQTFSVSPLFTNTVADPDMRTLGFFFPTNVDAALDMIKSKLQEAGFSNQVYTTGNCYVRVVAVKSTGA